MTEIFSPPEMLTLYRQAKDRRKQITIFAETNCCTEDEIIEALKAAGLSFRELPRRKRKEAKETNQPPETETTNAVPEVYSIDEMHELPAPPILDAVVKADVARAAENERNKLVQSLVEFCDNMPSNCYRCPLAGEECNFHKQDLATLRRYDAMKDKVQRTPTTSSRAGITTNGIVEYINQRKAQADELRNQLEAIESELHHIQQALDA